MTASTHRLSKAKIRKRKVELKRLHKIYSWRKMADEIYGGEVGFGVLQRFACEKDYIPKDEKILLALDLITPKNPFRILPRWYKRTNEALNFFNKKREQIKKMSDSAREESQRMRGK